MKIAKAVMMNIKIHIVDSIFVFINNGGKVYATYG